MSGMRGAGVGGVGATAPGPVAADPRRWRVLGVLCLSLVLVMVANSSLNVALPRLAADLDASDSQLQWMVDAYALVFAGLLFSAGTLGDRFGRKGALQLGLGVFLVSTALGATAGSAGGVIAARAVMGVGAALVMPSTLSILTNVFPAGERPRAIALWAGLSAGGASLGAPLTGFLLEHFWWGSIFLVNVPLVVLALVAGHRLVPTSRNPDHAPLDVPGAALTVVGVGALVYGIIEAPVHGWTGGATLAAFAVAVVALALFAWREATARHPMLDLRLFADRRFSMSSIGISLTFFALFGWFFLTSQYLQHVLGYSALRAGLVQMPMPLVLLAVAPQAPRLVARFGIGRVVASGLFVMAAGLVAFSRVGTGSSLVHVYVVLVHLAVGVAVTQNPLTALLMGSVPTSRAGVGSAMNDTTRELGGALGVAVMGSVLATRAGSRLDPALTGLPAEAREVAGSGLGGALTVAAELPGAAGEALATAARQAYVDGLGTAVLVAAGVVVVAGALAGVLLRPSKVGLQVVHAEPDGADDDLEVDVDDAAA